MKAKQRFNFPFLMRILLSIIKILGLFFLAIIISLIAYIVLYPNATIIVLTIVFNIFAFLYFSQKLWKKRFELQKEETQTIDTQADKYIYDLFTNQKHAIAFFEDLLANRLSQYRLISIYGIGGSGKSWLMRVYRYKAQSLGSVVSIVDGSSSKAVLDVLNVIRQDLEAKGLELSNFKNILEKYTSLQSKVSSESQSRKFVLKVATEIGKQIPVISQAASLVDTITQEEFLVFLKSFLSKDDIDLYINPEKALTDALVKDLNNLSPHFQLVLIFDTYEQMTGIDKWLKTFVSKLSRNILVVFAGQLSLSENWIDLRAITKIIPLELLNEEDTKICLENFSRVYYQRPIPSIEKEMIVRFSGGLPLAISWSVDLMSRYRVDKFSEVRNETIGNLVDTMTRVATNDLRRVLEACAIPRWFNENLLQFFFKEENVIFDYSSLRSLPFMRSRPEGLAVHDRVRDFILEDMQSRSLESYVLLNRKCADFLEEKIHTTISLSGKYGIEHQKVMVELIYHTLNINENDGFNLLYQEVFDALGLSKLDYCNLLLAEASLHNFNLENQKWLRYWRGELAYQRGDWQTSLQILEAFEHEEGDKHPALVYAFITLGKIFYQRGDLARAREMYHESLEVMKMFRGKIHREGYVTEQLAKVYRMEGEINNALLLHEQALAITRESKDNYQICSAPGSYGTTLMLAGKLTEGSNYLLRSIENSRKAGFNHFVCTGLRSRAVSLMYLGRMREAEENGKESLQIAEQLGDVYNKGFAKLALGQIYTEKGENLSTAQAMLEDAINDLTVVGAKFDLGNVMAALGNFYRIQGNIMEAKKSLIKAYDLLLPLTFRYGIGWVYFYQGKTFFADNDISSAKMSLLKCDEVASQISSMYLKSRSLLSLAEISIIECDQYNTQTFITNAINLAQEHQYFDVLAIANFYQGKTSIESKSDPLPFFWSALTNAINYNPFLFDNLAKDIKTCYEMNDFSSNDRYSSMKMLCQRWSKEQYEGKLWIQMEKNVRFKEKADYSSQLENILMESSTLCK